MSGYLYSTPYISILYLKSAIDNQNPEEASKYIDFPSVRNSLKSQLKVSLKDKNMKYKNENTVGNIGRVLLDPFFDSIIDRTLNYTVTPKGLQLLLMTGKLSKNDPLDNNMNKDLQIKKDNSQIKFHYKNANQFVLSSFSPQANKTIKAYWNRDGIIHWTLNSIELPDNLESLLPNL